MNDLDYFVRKCLVIDISDVRALRWVWYPSDKHRKNLIGSFAGGKAAPGYFKTSVKGRRIGNHVIVFSLHNGFWPKGFVDHIDGNPLNNSPDNLRDVSPSENQQNNRGKGFCWRESKKRWEAKITVNGSVVHVGTFDNMLDARAAYLSAKRKLHPSAPVL